MAKSAETNDDADYERIAKTDPDDDKIRKVRQSYREAQDHQRKWHGEAIESYDFDAGRQWSSDDLAQLEQDGRPIVTFDRCGPYIDSVCGSEVNNRQQIKYLPRTVGDSQQTELLTAAAQWVLDLTDAGDEESDAFRDVLVPGIGWIETRMDYDEDPDGKIVMERVPPLEMRWDPEARKRNLSDRRWQQRVKWLSRQDIKDQWPDADVTVSATPWGEETEKADQPHNANLAFLYRENSRDGYDAKSGKYRVVQHQYFDYEQIYRVIDPETQKIVTLTTEKFKIAQKAMADLQYTKGRRKIFKYLFVIGDEIVEEGVLKCGFNILPITGKRDNNSGLWYGMMRVMKDPQRWANKFLAQIMQIVNSNAKGGLMAEVDAFIDPKKAEQQWSDPASVILLKRGALSGKKIQERTASQYPQGLDRLLQFAINSIPATTGVNLEFMGQQDNAQANVLEETRRKAAFIVLAGFFDSLRLYRKNQGRLLAHFIKEYLNDGRIIRITTDEGEKAVPLRLSEETITYDVIVDQAPDSPNLKAEVWREMMTIVPSMLKAGIQPPASFFKFSPLPASVAQEYQDQMQGKLPPKAQEAMQGMQQQIQSLSKENQELKQQTQIKVMQDQTKKQLGTQKNQIDALKAKMSGGGGGDPQADGAVREHEAQIAEQSAMSEFKREMMAALAEGQRKADEMARQHAHERALADKDLELAERQMEAKAAQQQMQAVQSSRVDEKTVQADVTKITKVVDAQSKDISALMKMVEGLAKTIQKMDDEPEEEKPTTFNVIRDATGKIKTITAVQ